MDNPIKRIGETKIVPVLVVQTTQQAVCTAEALAKGGIDILEVTLRTEAGVASIAEVKKEFPNMLIGAGSVLNLEMAKKAAEAGAEFIVMPGYYENIVKWCIEASLSIIPGCITPTEIGNALQYGLDILKFFPANIFGGINAIKALAGPFPSVRFIPTGGIDLTNLKEFTEHPSVYAVGGGWLCSPKLVMEGNFQRITELAMESRRQIA